jgi:carbamoyltransferase
MEYGPRALGNRSILASTEDAQVNDRLNARLGRSEFMPFAPSTLAEHAADCYLDYGPGADLTSRFMTITFDCSDRMKAASPAVVHLDGTARPQVVHEADSPSYHRILRLVFERTGVPSVVNTSFNLHGEPIVCSPRDAIRSFRAARLDALAIGPFLVRLP